MDNTTWQTTYDDCCQRVRDQFQDRIPPQDLAVGYAKQVDVYNESCEFAIKYAQWSLATETVMVMQNGTDYDRKLLQSGSSPLVGRGQLPQFEHKSLAGKSSSKPAEHANWNLQEKNAAQGNSLF